MPNPDYTHVTFVVDRSGSMRRLAEDAMGGINTLIKEQYEEDGKITFTLVDFDNKSETIERMQPNYFEYHLSPRGGTALFDAIGQEIVKTREDLAKITETDKPGRVLFVIVTDGHENSSLEYQTDQVRELIEESRAAGWQFQFIGAEESALQAGRIGLQDKSTRMRNNRTSMRGTYDSMNSELKAYRKKLMSEEFVMPDRIEFDDDFEDKK